MKTVSLIGIALALCAPALVQARTGGRVGAVQRIESSRTIATARDVDIGRAVVVRGDVQTGTRIPRRRADDPNRHSPARRRWNAAHPSGPELARRRWNAANPPTSPRGR